MTECSLCHQELRNPVGGSSYILENSIENKVREIVKEKKYKEGKTKESYMPAIEAACISTTGNVRLSYKSISR